MASPLTGSCRHPHPVPPARALTVIYITSARSGIPARWFLQEPTSSTTSMGTHCHLHHTCKQWHLHPLVLGGTHTHLHRNSLSHHICKQWHLHSLELARTLLQYHLNGTHCHIAPASREISTCWFLQTATPTTTFTDTHCYITPANSGILTCWFLQARTPTTTCMGTQSFISHLLAVTSPPAGSCMHLHSMSHLQAVASTPTTTCRGTRRHLYHNCKQRHLLQLLVLTGTHTHYHLHGHSQSYITPPSSATSTESHLARDHAYGL